MLVMVLAGLLTLTLGLGKQKQQPCLDGSGWISPERANGVYVQRTMVTYIRKCHTDVYRLQYSTEWQAWLWMYNDQIIAIREEQDVVGEYRAIYNPLWSSTVPTVSKHN